MGGRILAATSSISGTGNVGVYGSGLVTINGALNMSGAVMSIVQAGSIDINGPFPPPPAKSPSAERGEFQHGTDYHGWTGYSKCRLSLGGSANMTLNGGFHWSGGELTGTGTTTLGGTVTLDGSDKYLTGNRQVASSGTRL